MCLDERRVSRLDLSRRSFVRRSSGGMFLVLACLSSLVSCVWRPPAPSWFQEDVARYLRVTFLLFAVNYFFYPNL